MLEYLPHRKRDGTSNRDQGLHVYVAGHGYACVQLYIRGMDDSKGLLSAAYTQVELLDGFAMAKLRLSAFCYAVTMACRLPRCNRPP